MADSDEKKRKGIPPWQMQDSTASASEGSDLAQGTKEETMPNSERQPLLEQAAKFLEDTDIRTAPIERKRHFLGLKGLTEAEIQDLLQDQEHALEQHTPEAEVMEDYGIEKEDLELQTSQAMSKSTETPSSSQTPVKKEASSPESQSDDRQPSSPGPQRDQPPIITYPEFLLHSQRSPPLITAQRLLTALYVASGAAATIYGTSKYVVEPMIESLTSARHSLAETASMNLDTLNSKLESAVSKLPETTFPGDREEDSDADSIDSDPSRFFNRSAGTQTSPNISHTPSTTSEAITPMTPVHNHETTLSSIQSRLGDLQLKVTSDSVKDSISGLRKYLDNLPNTHSTPHNARLWDKAKSDEYGRLKAEIRGVKGVLLSARNFPSGVSVR